MGLCCQLMGRLLREGSMLDGIEGVSKSAIRRMLTGELRRFAGSSGERRLVIRQGGKPVAVLLDARAYQAMREELEALRTEAARLETGHD